MKTLTKIIIAATILTASATSQADWVSGHFRSNGTYVAPYYRTPANGTPYDNLSYRGYPSQQPGYVSPRRFGGDSSVTMPKSPSFESGLQTMPKLNRSYSPRPF